MINIEGKSSSNADHRADISEDALRHGAHKAPETHAYAHQSSRFSDMGTGRSSYSSGSYSGSSDSYSSEDRSLGEEGDQSRDQENSFTGGANSPSEYSTDSRRTSGMSTMSMEGKPIYEVKLDVNKFQERAKTAQEFKERARTATGQNGSGSGSTRPFTSPEQFHSTDGKRHSILEAVAPEVPQRASEWQALTNPSTGYEVPQHASEWQVLTDPSTGYVYYWNENTNESTWNCPPELQNDLIGAYTPDPTFNEPKDTSNNSTLHGVPEHKQTVGFDVPEENEPVVHLGSMTEIPQAYKGLEKHHIEAESDSKRPSSLLNGWPSSIPSTEPNQIYQAHHPFEGQRPQSTPSDFNPMAPLWMKGVKKDPFLVRKEEAQAFLEKRGKVAKRVDRLREQAYFELCAAAQVAVAHMHVRESAQKQLEEAGRLAIQTTLEIERNGQPFGTPPIVCPPFTGIQQTKDMSLTSPVQLFNPMEAVWNESAMQKDEASLQKEQALRYLQQMGQKAKRVALVREQAFYDLCGSGQRAIVLLDLRQCTQKQLAETGKLAIKTVLAREQASQLFQSVGEKAMFLASGSIKPKQNESQGPEKLEAPKTADSAKKMRRPRDLSDLGAQDLVFEKLNEALNPIKKNNKTQPLTQSKQQRNLHEKNQRAAFKFLTDRAKKGSKHWHLKCTKTFPALVLIGNQAKQKVARNEAFQFLLNCAQYNLSKQLELQNVKLKAFRFLVRKAQTAMGHYGYWLLWNKQNNQQGSFEEKQEAALAFLQRRGKRVRLLLAAQEQAFFWLAKLAKHADLAQPRLEAARLVVKQEQRQRTKQAWAPQKKSNKNQAKEMRIHVFKSGHAQSIVFPNEKGPPKALHRKFKLPHLSEVVRFEELTGLEYQGESVDDISLIIDRHSKGLDHTRKSTSKDFQSCKTIPSFQELFPSAVNLGQPISPSSSNMHSTNFNQTVPPPKTNLMTGDQLERNRIDGVRVSLQPASPLSTNQSPNQLPSKRNTFSQATHTKPKTSGVRQGRSPSQPRNAKNSSNRSKSRKGRTRSPQSRSPSARAASRSKSRSMSPGQMRPLTAFMLDEKTQFLKAYAESKYANTLYSAISRSDQYLNRIGSSPQTSLSGGFQMKDFTSSFGDSKPVLAFSDFKMKKEKNGQKLKPIHMNKHNRNIIEIRAQGEQMMS